MATVGFFGLDEVAEILESPFGNDAWIKFSTPVELLRSLKRVKRGIWKLLSKTLTTLANLKAMFDHKQKHNNIYMYIHIHIY